jgi:uncharacterized protein
MTKLKTIAIVALALALQHLPLFALEAALINLPFAKKLQLAKAGDPDAKMAVGDAYEKGDGVPLSGSKAAKWYREAALVGNVEAQFRLAKLVSKGAPGLKVDKPTALKLLETAAKKGHAPSQNLYGLMLQNGDGLVKDEKQAVTWYRKAADQGLAVAQNNLGVMVLNGNGTTRNIDDAFRLFTKAADGKDAWAMNNLGGMYEMGWGAPKDVEKAKTLYKQAATGGIEIAIKNLTRLGVVWPESTALKP